MKIQHFTPVSNQLEWLAVRKMANWYGTSSAVSDFRWRCFLTRYAVGSHDREGDSYGAYLMVFYSVLGSLPSDTKKVKPLPHGTIVDGFFVTTVLAKGTNTLTSFLVAYPFRCYHQFFRDQSYLVLEFSSPMKVFIMLWTQAHWFFTSHLWPFISGRLLTEGDMFLAGADIAHIVKKSLSKSARSGHFWRVTTKRQTPFKMDRWSSVLSSSALSVLRTKDWVSALVLCQSNAPAWYKKALQKASLSQIT